MSLILLLGKANQKLAAAASEVYLIVAGIPIAIKAATARPRGERS